MSTLPGGIKEGGPNCYDCSAVCSDYMVHDHVWREAMPHYSVLKSTLQKVYKDHPNIPERLKVLIRLCFPCLEKRLNRQLTIEDFDLKVPINSGIALGYCLGRNGYV